MRSSLAVQPATPHRPQTNLDLGHLLRVVFDAMAMWPPDLVQSFLGPRKTWLPPYNRYSEFTLADPWQFWRALRFLANITLPSISGAPPPFLPPLLNMFWQPTQILQRPDYYDSYASFPDEHWFFINGIMTNPDLAQLNAQYLTYLFHRPVTLIQNSTDGLALDLWECARGKESDANTESGIVAFPPIYDALTGAHTRRVVVVCHSQGTIIMALVLRGLQGLAEHWAQKIQPAGVAAGRGLLPEGLPAGAPLRIFQDDLPIDPDDFPPLSEEEWGKLEVYCFANCADEMRFWRQPDAAASCDPVPWIENFANERDVVARLGMLAPYAEDEGIHIEGPAWVQRKAWGHLLNQDYLLPIEEGQKRGRRRGGSGNAAPFELINGDAYPWATAPRLFRYINGGAPVA